MKKEYRTVRIAYETKYWLNELISAKEKKLKGRKEMLIVKYETALRGEQDLYGICPTLSLSVSAGSIVEAAYNYFMNIKDNLDWSSTQNQIETAKKEISTDIDVGTLTPRLYLYDDIYERLQDLRYELKPPEMQRGLMLNYVLKVLIFLYYQNEAKQTNSNSLKS